MGLVTRLLSRPQDTEITTSQGLDAFLRQGARESWSGMTVTAKHAVQVAAVLACTRVIAEDIGKLPAIVYRRLPEDRRERARSASWWRLIHDQPNRWMSSQAFRETLTAWALLRGNGYALPNVVRGEVRELLPLHPDRVRVEQLDDWELVYWVRGADNVERMLSRRQIFHVMGLSLDGKEGVGIVELARQTIGSSRASQRQAAKFFANGLQTSGVFTHPSKLSDLAYKRLQASLIEDHTAESAWNPMLLEEGMSWVTTGLTNEASQFLESRKFEIEEIARWFRVAPHKIAHLERATFSNIEHQGQEHDTDTLLPWAKRWESAWARLLPAELYAELLFDGLLRGTTKERYEAYQVAAGGNAPWMSRNEIRARENLDPLDGLDDMLVPLNMSGGEEAPDDDDA